jgi:hypothetical protein
LLSTAILAVRNAMQERRARAERAWRDALECLLAPPSVPSSARTPELRQCRATIRRAAELSVELPEHGGTQLELRAALDELVSAIESSNERQLASARDRSARAGGALGWR